MDIHEEKVLLSADRLGRVAIVRRADGLFCLYAHRHWSIEEQQTVRVEKPQDRRWSKDYDPTLYYDAIHNIETRPEPGLYDTVGSAEAEARRMLGLTGE